MSDTPTPTAPFSLQLYDALMANIEPELTTENVDALDALYIHESPEQKTARMARYDRAFATFEERFSQLLSAWTQQYQDLKRELMAKVEKEDADKESSHLSDIENAMDA